ncbi:MAG: DUF3386 domain-containing protein [Spirulinaceae cyanobacterium]
MTATQVSARELFQAAYENRYTWDANFPGYTAEVRYTSGDGEYTGKVKVGADLKADITGVGDETAQKAIHQQLWETAIHRVRRGFEQVHGDNTFRYGQKDETGAIELLMGGKAEGDRYKLRNNEVCHVHRHIHGVVVTIDTFSSHATGAGYLSHTYDSVYHDPQTGEQKGGKSVFEDDYTKVGDYVILSRRLIKTEGVETPSEFAFSNIELLA